jgi:hypothetical protein
MAGRPPEVASEVASLAREGFSRNGSRREDELVVKRTLMVLVGACLAVVLLAGATLAALPLIASTGAGERVGTTLSSLPALAELPSSSAPIKRSRSRAPGPPR